MVRRTRAAIDQRIAERKPGGGVVVEQWLPGGNNGRAGQTVYAYYRLSDMLEWKEDALVAIHELNEQEVKPTKAAACRACKVLWYHPWLIGEMLAEDLLVNDDPLPHRYKLVALEWPG